MSKSTQWNPDLKGRFDREEDTETRKYITEHPDIAHTSYMEVSDLLGTSGCSHGAPWWDWQVLGVYTFKYGKLVISPRLWLNEHDDGSVFISEEPHFEIDLTKGVHHA